MTQPTLPVLGGGERELKLGDRVRLGNGVELTPQDNRNQPDQRHNTPVTELSYPGFWHPWVDVASVAWWPDGKLYDWKRQGRRSDTTDLDIVLILGPSEETHGDGTVTKLVTWPVTAETTYWEEFEIIHMEPSWRFKPKPTPSPTYTERLIEAVRKGEVVLPPKSSCVTKLLYMEGEGVWLWMGCPDHCKVPQSCGTYSKHVNGPLPPWQPGDETSINLATVRDALTKQETT